MEKEALLQELAIKISTGEIKREELIEQLNIDFSKQKEISKTTIFKNVARFPLEIFYAIGAMIVAVGIMIFISQIWDIIGSLGRISITLGLGLLLAAIGSALFKEKPESTIGTVFHFIGGGLIPSGALVTLYELRTGQDIFWPIALVFGIIFIFYLLLNYIYRKPILTFFAIANGTIFAYCLIKLMSDSVFYFRGDLFVYLTMTIGISYILLAYAFRGTWNNYLVGFLSFFGSIGFLSAAFSRVFDSIIWQVLFFFIVAIGFYAAVVIKSRRILIISAIFLVSHISYITGKYFSDSIGWPITLIVLGFVFIGMGYAVVAINKNYITSAK